MRTTRIVDIITASRFVWVIVLFVLLLASCRTECDLVAFSENGDGFRVTLERGSIKEDGSDDATIEGYKTCLRSSFFIKTNHASSISIQGLRDIHVVIWQYDSNHKMIESVKILSSVELNSKCSFIRILFQTTNEAKHCWVQFEGSKQLPEEEKKSQIAFPFERLVYAVENDLFTTALLMLPPNYSIEGDPVPLIIWDSGDGSFVSWDSHVWGEGNLGRINGLNFLRDSGFAVLEIYSWGSNYYQKYPQCGMHSAMPIPTHIATHNKGVEYVLDHYNLNPDSIFHLSKSGGGKIDAYYAMECPPFNLKSIYAFAPVVNDLNFIAWRAGVVDYRKALLEELNLQGTVEEIDYYLNGEPYDFDVSYKTENNLDIVLESPWQMQKELGQSFINRNAEKLKMVAVDWMNVSGRSLSELVEDNHFYTMEFWKGFNRYYDEEKKKFESKWDDNSIPASKDYTFNRYDLTRKSSGIPFTVIMSPTDEQTPYWIALEFVKQLQNVNNCAKIITLDTGGHSAPDLSTAGPNVKSDVTTRLGIHYDKVSIGWYIAVEDIYNRFLLPTS